jgi:hypothetical protein
LWGSVKYEEVYLRGYDSVGDANESIGRYPVPLMDDAGLRALTK